jgi:hypothetical protein
VLVYMEHVGDQGLVVMHAFEFEIEGLANFPCRPSRYYTAIFVT